MAQGNLIQGAAKAYAPTYTDAGEAFGRGAASVGSGMTPTTAANLGSMKSTDAQVKGYINSLNTEMDLLSLSEAEQNSIKGYLFGQKQRFAQLATELTQIDATSPNYLDLKNEMDGIKQSFLNLKSQTDSFKKRKVQYLEDLENGRLSKGNKPGDYNIAGKVYGGGSLMIDPNGGINVVVDGGKDIVKYTDVADPFLKDFKTADEILQQGNRLYTAGMKLDPSKESLLINKLKAQLSKDGALESVIEDGLINDQRINVDLSTYQTREDAINDVSRILLKGYRDTAEAGYKEKLIKEERERLRRGRGRGTTGDPALSMTKRTGYSEADRKIYLQRVQSLKPGETVTVPNFSGTNDPSAKRGYGQTDYKITKASDGNYVFVGTNSEKEVVQEGIITPAQLEKEFLGSPKKKLSAKELIAQYKAQVNNNTN